MIDIDSAEEGDLIVSWRANQAMRPRRKKRIRIRKNGYAAWVCSLQVGDEVVVRFPWQDRDCPGGKTTRAWVKWVKEDRFLVHWMTFGGERGINEQSNVFYKPYGGGGSYHALMHPTRPVVYSGDLGYVFKEEVEDWTRRRAAWVTRKANAASC